MKPTLHFIIITLLLQFLAYSQSVSVEQKEEFKIVKVNQGSSVNLVVPTVYGNIGTYNKPANEPPKDNIQAFNWVLKFTASGKVFKDVSFYNTQIGYIVTELGSVYKTTNGGDNWTSLMNLGFPYYWYGVHALSIDTVVIAGFNNTDSIRHGALRWSFNGGTTWTSDIVLSRPTNGVGWLDRVHFYDQNTGIVFNGLSGGIYYTTTGGKTSNAWNFVQADPSSAWFAGNYDYLPNGTVYAAGIHIVKSTDRGMTWTSGPSADAVFDGGIDFLDQNTLYGWTGGGQISAPVSGWTHRTTDGGNTWGPRQMTFPFPVRCVKFFDTNTGFALCGNVQSSVGAIYSTSNGGTNWSEDINTGAEMFSFDYKIISPDSMDIWAVGSTGGGTGYTGKLYKARSANLVGLQPINSQVPRQFSLYQNYPNPFNPKTVIRFDVPPLKGDRGMIKIVIFDILGREIKKLVNKNLQSGNYQIVFDAANFPSGIYFYKLDAGDYSDVKKMILIK